MIKFKNGDVIHHVVTRKMYEVRDYVTVFDAYILYDLQERFSVEMDADVAHERFRAGPPKRYDTPSQAGAYLQHGNAFKVEEIHNFESHVEKYIPDVENKLHWLITGLIEETGELLQIVREMTYKEKVPEPTHVLEELGDIQYMVTGLMNYFGYTQEEVEVRNIRKLQTRFPKGKYDITDAIKKVDHDE